MSIFGDDRIGLLEFQEGEMRGSRKSEYLWHYNWGEYPPETWGWHGLIWYDRKNEKAAELIDRFCDSVDKAYRERDATYNEVRRLADFFVNSLSDNMKRIIILFDPKQYHKQ